MDFRKRGSERRATCTDTRLSIYPVLFLPFLIALCPVLIVADVLQLSQRIVPLPIASYTLHADQHAFAPLHHVHRLRRFVLAPAHPRYLGSPVVWVVLPSLRLSLRKFCIRYPNQKAIGRFPTVHGQIACSACAACRNRNAVPYIYPTSKAAISRSI